MTSDSAVDGAVVEAGTAADALEHFAVVAGQSEDVTDALIHAGLAGADIADAGEQLIEVVGEATAALPGTAVLTTVASTV